jgi:hypothetical protein
MKVEIQNLSVIIPNLERGSERLANRSMDRKRKRVRRREV